MCWNKFSGLRIMGEHAFRISVRLVVKHVAAPTYDGEKYYF